MNKALFETAMKQFDYYLSQLSTEQKLVLAARLVGRLVKEMHGRPFPTAIELEHNSTKLGVTSVMREAAGDSELFCLSVALEVAETFLTEYVATLKGGF